MNREKAQATFSTTKFYQFEIELCIQYVRYGFKLNVKVGNLC